jgi:hypothetical protein
MSATLPLSVKNRTNSDVLSVTIHSPKALMSKIIPKKLSMSLTTGSHHRALSSNSSPLSPTSSLKSNFSLGFGTHFHPSYTTFTFAALTPQPSVYKQLLSVLIANYHYFLAIPENVTVIVSKLKEILMNFINNGDCPLVTSHTSLSSVDTTSWTESLPILSLVSFISLSLHTSNKIQLVSKFNLFYLFFQLLSYCNNNLLMSPWYFLSEMPSNTTKDISSTTSANLGDMSVPELSLNHSSSLSTFSSRNFSNPSLATKGLNKVIISSNTSSFSSGFVSSFTSVSSLLTSGNFATYRNFYLSKLGKKEKKKNKREILEKSTVRVMSLSRSARRQPSRTNIDNISLPGEHSLTFSPFSSPLFGLTMVTLITTVLVNLMQSGIPAVRIFYRYGCVVCSSF